MNWHLILAALWSAVALPTLAWAAPKAIAWLTLHVGVKRERLIVDIVQEAVSAVESLAAKGDIPSPTEKKQAALMYIVQKLAMLHITLTPEEVDRKIEAAVLWLKGEGLELPKATPTPNA